MITAALLTLYNPNPDLVSFPLPFLPLLYRKLNIDDTSPPLFFMMPDNNDWPIGRELKTFWSIYLINRIIGTIVPKFHKND